MKLYDYEKNYKKVIALLLEEIERKDSEIYWLKMKNEELKKAGENNG